MTKNIKSICATLFISLFLSCNNGIEELQKENHSIRSISNLRQSFLDVFTSFGNMVTDAFGIKADTKKSEIGKYFTDIADTMKTVKAKLTSEITNDKNYENYGKVKTAFGEFIEILDKIGNGAKQIVNGIGAGNIGNTVSNQDSAPAGSKSINFIVQGIKGMVDVVLKGKGDAEATKTKEDQHKTVGKLFSGKANDGTEAIAAAASASIGAVTGADILQAIAKSGGLLMNLPH
ncbi:Variable outer membrane protein (plasmid) [Borrelia coriaceae ATCC 43381]|uniref:Variable large protein n=1 Tax=Borrelia coriaceae ATCC 43381 TaxID=1408429 RepID=W5SXA0_9SPIR|nr:Variable outer membrane protein [Borrelia coriaceae ATCC 43381]